MPQERNVYGPGVKDTVGIGGWMIAAIVAVIFVALLGGLMAAGTIKIDTLLQPLRNEREDKRTEGITEQLDFVMARAAAANGYLQDFDRLGRMVTGFNENDPKTWTDSQHADVGYMCTELTSLDSEDIQQHVNPRIVTLMSLEGCRRV